MFRGLSEWHPARLNIHSILVSLMSFPPSWTASLCCCQECITPHTETESSYKKAIFTRSQNDFWMWWLNYRSWTIKYSSEKMWLPVWLKTQISGDLGWLQLIPWTGKWILSNFKLTNVKKIHILRKGRFTYNSATFFILLSLVSIQMTDKKSIIWVSYHYSILQFLKFKPRVIP